MNTPPARDLPALLAGLSPCRVPGIYVFRQVADITTVDIDGLVMCLHEPGGWTLVTEVSSPDAEQASGAFVAAWIRLDVHSALEAVGLTAAVSNRLAAAGIACNMVAGHDHDHLFVPLAEADVALAALNDLSATPFSARTAP